MKTARLIVPNRMDLLDVARPVPGPRDVLVRVEAAGLCGSDRHMFRGEYPTAMPVTLGHEFCGIVESVGEDAKRFAPGDRVTADPNIACGHCAACRRGQVNLCSNLQAIGVTRDGGFAEWVVIPEQQAIALPGSLDPLHGAFSEPLACCLHGLDIAAIRPGDSVAVLGGGVIGLLMVQLARLAGATVVVLSTRQAPRRDLAIKLGATHVVDPLAGSVAAAVREIVPGGVDVALECAGVPDTLQDAIGSTRDGGQVVLFGVFAKGQRVDVEPWDLLVREIRLQPAYLNPHTHERAAAMVAVGVLKLDPLISRVVELADLPTELAAPPRLGDVKVMVRP